MNKEEQAQIIIDATHSLYEAKAKIESLERALAEARAALDEQHAGTDAVWNERHKVTQERDAALALLREAGNASSPDPLALAVAEAAEKWLKAREGIAAADPDAHGFGQYLTACEHEAHAAKALEDAVRDRRQSQAQK